MIPWVSFNPLKLIKGIVVGESVSCTVYSERGEPCHEDQIRVPARQSPLRTHQLLHRVPLLGAAKFALHIGKHNPTQAGSLAGTDRGEAGTLLLVYL